MWRGPGANRAERWQSDRRAGNARMKRRPQATPSRMEAVVVPGFTPTTPGVTPMDTPTNATVGSSASDRALRDSVASTLAADSALQGATLNVTVRNGVVNVTGSARDRTQADRARALAEGAVGVSRVSASISTGG